MSTLHEQARAEAEKRYQPLPIQSVSQITGRVQTGDLNVPYRDTFIKGFLAGHEAASRPRQVSTVVELDALPVGSVVLADGEVWQKGINGWWVTWQGEARGPRTILPARVLHDPEESAPTTPTDQDAYRPVERFGAEGGRLLPARTRVTGEEG